MDRHTIVPSSLEESGDSLGIELSEEEENEPILTKWAEEDELMIELPKNNLIEYFNTFKILSDKNIF